MTGVIVQIMDEVEILSKKGQKKQKKEIVLADDSNHEVSLVLWENYQNDKFKLGSIVTIKNGKVCFFSNCKYLSNSFNSVVFIDELKIPEVKELGDWSN